MEKNAIIRDYIANEITQNYHSITKDQQLQLISISNSFFEKQITLEQARLSFARITSDLSPLEKLRQIQDMGAKPLPEKQPENLSLLARGRKRSFPWSEQEDLRLIAAVNKYGARDWKQIAEFVGGGRNSSQCNQRWCRALDPKIIHSNWTPEEDSQLIRAIEVLGKTSWCQVAKILSGRTDLQCRYRYLQLSKLSNNEASPSPEQSNDEASPIKQLPQPNVNPKKRRNSISIAPFACHFEPPSFQEQTFEMLPYYLESSLKPRPLDAEDRGKPMLHRIPPLLVNRLKNDQ